EFPPVRFGTERELQQSVLVEARIFAVGRVLGPAGQLAPAGSYYELARSLRIGNLIGPLRREPLVVVGVPVQDELRTRRVHLVQEPARLLRVTVPARSPARAMPDGQDRREPPRGQIPAQPLQLRRMRVLLDLAV